MIIYTGAALRGAANAERAACTKLLDVHATALEASLEGTAAAIDAAAEEAVARFSQGVLLMMFVLMM